MRRTGPDAHSPLPATLLRKARSPAPPYPCCAAPRRYPCSFAACLNAFPSSFFLIPFFFRASFFSFLWHICVFQSNLNRILSGKKGEEEAEEESQVCTAEKAFLEEQR